MFTPYHQTRDALKLTIANFRNVLNGTLIRGPYAYHRVILRDFVESIVHDKPPPITLAESLRNMMITEGAKQSLRKGRAISLNELPLIEEIREALSG